MALHRRFRPVFKKYAPRGTARFAKPLQGPFSLVAKHPQKHKNRPEIGRFSHFNPGAEMRLFSLFSASEAPEKWLCDAICRKKQLFAGSFGSRSHSFCSFTAVVDRNYIQQNSAEKERDQLSAAPPLVPVVHSIPPAPCPAPEYGRYWPWPSTALSFSRGLFGSRHRRLSFPPAARRTRYSAP